MTLHKGKGVMWKEFSKFEITVKLNCRECVDPKLVKLVKKIKMMKHISTPFPFGILT